MPLKSSAADDASCRRDRIRTLNDQLRVSGRGGRVQVTQTVLHRGPQFLQRAVHIMQEFTKFSDANDPYGEHDFGSFKLDQDTLFFKIDYYDATLTHGAEDPSDPDQCTRVLTLMLAEDY